ncbi:MAG TPA: TrkA family potassium uptake protein [Thermomicrobiales bacterium]|nr:TrkA family potassium uptake protein [Thermomicrobiales bacterium]
MYIIVVGGGKVGYYLTRTLIADGHEVLLIEIDPQKSKLYSERLGTIVLNGDGAEAAVQARAGAARADVVVAVTGDDEDNLVICQLAKQKFQVGKTITRVNNPKNEELFRLLGIDVTVSQTNYIQNLIGQAIPERPFIHLMNLRHADLAIIEASITHRSPVANRTISEIDLPVDCAIAAIARGKELIVPSPDTVIEPEDEIIAVAHRRDEHRLRELLIVE